jgi:hypothetical protein
VECRHNDAICSIIGFGVSHRSLIMLRKQVLALITLTLAALAHGADQTDSLTGLPVPDVASGLKVDSGTKLDPAPICKSTLTSQYYTVFTGKTSTAIAWYGVHLKGFRHLHGYGMGRSQDLFVNADGSMYVGITGSPAKDGEDTDAYAISYAIVKPGLPEKTMKGLLSQNVTC